MSMALVKYGRIPETSRLPVLLGESARRGDCVVVRTVRGLELATLLEDVQPSNPDFAPVSESVDFNAVQTSVDNPPHGPGDGSVIPNATATMETSTAIADLTDQPGILRVAAAEDLARSRALQAECEDEFSVWQKRVGDWKLDLAVIDLERTLDGRKLIVYVLNERGPDCTKLAIQAAAAGLGLIEVQSVGPSGLSAPNMSGGCATGGCGSGGCGH